MFEYQPVSKRFYAGLDEGKFIGIRCPDCGRVSFPPYPACGTCGHVGFDFVELSGDCTVKEIYSVSPMMTIAEFMPFAPVYTAEIELAEGTKLACMIFGVNRKNYHELRDQCPIPGKLVVMPMDGYNSFACAINGAVPKRKESKAQVMNQEQLIGTLGNNSKTKNDHPMTGEYDLVGSILGRSQPVGLTLSVEGNTPSGFLDIMDEKVMIESGEVTGDDFKFLITMRGTEVTVSGAITNGHLKGVADITGMQLELEGDKK